MSSQAEMQPDELTAKGVVNEGGTREETSAHMRKVGHVKLPGRGERINTDVQMDD